MGPHNEGVFLGGVERQGEEGNHGARLVSSGAGMDLFKWHGLWRSQHGEHRREVELLEDLFMHCHGQELPLGSPAKQARGPREESQPEPMG